jgi:hypothetical protein
MRPIKTILSIAIAGASVASMLSGCAVTKTETDYYTITDRDSTIREQVRNVPGEENGVVYPSSKVTEIERDFMTHDSSYDRRYPAFLRLGGIEFAGLVGTSSAPGIGTGLLGIYDLFTIDSTYKAFQQPGDSTVRPNSIFKGRIFRVLPYEYRLRWFDDAPNWTYGGSAYENLAQDEDHSLTSVLANVYARRRIYIRDRIPYVIFAPFIGASLYPSAYVNLGGELQFGSVGGFNLRAYTGLVSGFTWSKSGTITFPYVGLGVSAFDFTNRVEETEHEWKDYVHSAVEIEGIEVALLKSKSYLSLFDSSLSGLPFQAFSLRALTAHYPLPFADGHFWAGTSLINYIGLGFTQQGIGILPIRAGYRQYLMAKDMMVEPFVEYNYYPSHWLNIGARVKLDVFVGISVIGGYMTGSSGSFLPKALNSVGSPFGSDFSSAYLGVAIAGFDHLYSPEEITEMHKHEAQ